MHQVFHLLLSRKWEQHASWSWGQVPGYLWMGPVVNWRKYRSCFLYSLLESFSFIETNGRVLELPLTRHEAEVSQTSGEDRPPSRVLFIQRIPEI